MPFWQWLVHTGLIAGDPNYYSGGQASPAEYAHAIRVAVNALGSASDPRVRGQFWQALVSAGVIAGDPNYYSGGGASAAEIEHAITVAGGAFAQNPTAGAIPVPGSTAAAPATPGIVDPSRGITDVAPVRAGNATIPQGATAVVVNNPLGSDLPQLYYLVYEWRGVKLAYEVGSGTRFNDLFGSLATFAATAVINQEQFDAVGHAMAGPVDEILNSTESIGSRIERETRELGLEDIPSWMANAPDVLALVAEATSNEWSSGRLWQELSTTGAFQGRFGTAWQRYMQEGLTIGEAVNTLVRDENVLRDAIRPFFVGTEADNTQFLQELLNQGWTGGAAAQVLEQAEVLRRDPDSLTLSNFILQSSGMSTLDEVGFLNALNGVGPQDVIEALNTATAARALDESGIDLADEDVNLIMDLVDTSDRLLTVDSWRSLSQELALNLVRFNTEIDQSKLGVDRDDLVAAAFGQESPTGKSSGEVMSLLARFERDRRAASQGFEGTTAFMNQEGRLQIQGIAGL